MFEIPVSFSLLKYFIILERLIWALLRGHVVNMNLLRVLIPSN